MRQRGQRCEDRVGGSLRSTIDELQELWMEYQEGGSRLYEYGLSFDYVAPGTFRDQDTGYFRWQLSWGGPSDEFRFYTDLNLNVWKIDYWYLDWFDGAHRTLSGYDKELLMEIWEQIFKESGAAEAALKKARRSI